MPIITMKELVRRIRQLEKELARCTRCGICQTVCPVYNITGNEADVARGKLSIIDGLIREMFADPDGVYERLSRCLLCGSCAAECPRGVDMIGIVLRTRAMIREYKGLPFHQKLLFRRIIGVPRRFDRLSDWASRCQHLIPLPARKVPALNSVSPSLYRRFPQLATVPFRKSLQSTGLEAGDITVAFFIGCLIDKVFPDVGSAVMDILAHNGIRVVVPENQACCGIPALSAGDREGFDAMVFHNLKIFDPRSVDYIVSGCATCSAVIRTQWPALFRTASDDTKAMVDALAEKTLDISEFVVRVTGLSDRFNIIRPGETIPVTYHDPCHLKRTMGISDAPRKMISANPNFILTEMNRPDACCGMGGSFGIHYPELSRTIGEKKGSDIAATGARIVATGCPACMMQLHDFCMQLNPPVTVRHTAQIYAQGLNPTKE